MALITPFSAFTDTISSIGRVRLNGRDWSTGLILIIFAGSAVVFFMVGIQVHIYSYLLVLSVELAYLLGFFLDFCLAFRGHYKTAVFVLPQMNMYGLKKNQVMVSLCVFNI